MSEMARVVSQKGPGLGVRKDSVWASERAQFGSQKGIGLGVRKGLARGSGRAGLRGTRARFVGRKAPSLDVTVLRGKCPLNPMF